MRIETKESCRCFSLWQSIEILGKEWVSLFLNEKRWTAMRYSLVTLESVGHSRLCKCLGSHVTFLQVIEECCYLFLLFAFEVENVLYFYPSQVFNLISLRNGFVTKLWKANKSWQLYIKARRHSLLAFSLSSLASSSIILSGSFVFPTFCENSTPI